MIFCRYWWPWTKPGYNTTTRRQSNNEWSGGITAHPVPKDPECKNPLENLSPRFLGITTASSSLIIFQRPKLSTRNITHLCWWNWRTWKKNAAGSHQGGLLLARKCSGSPGACNSEENGLPRLPISSSPPILRICPRRTTTCSMDWKKQL